MACMLFIAFSFLRGGGIWGNLAYSADGKDDHEPTTIAAGHGGSTVKPSSREFDTDAEASIASSAETSSKVESSLAKPSRSTSGTEQNLKQQRWISSSVTPNQITSAIAASEKSRLRCSVVVALSAVLSHLGFPLLGSNLISSIINFRPLYLVLLTNVTLVLFNNQRAFKGAVEAENKIPSTGGTDWTEQASEALKVAWWFMRMPAWECCNVIF